MRNRPSKQDPYREPADCIRAARAGIAEVMHSLEIASPDESERCGDLLGDVAMQLQSAAALLRDVGQPRDGHLRFEVEQLRRQLKTLSVALAESDRLVSGWIRRIGTEAGYTEQGGTAPLTLVKKVNITG